MSHDAEPDGAGWRTSPVTAGIAGVVILLALSNLVCRVACRGRGAQSQAEATVAMICPHCGKVYEVSPEDVRADPESSPDVVQQEATKVPCPKCGKTDSAIAMTCPKCGKAFAPPKVQDPAKSPKCPHCGERLWGK